MPYTVKEMRRDNERLLKRHKPKSLKVVHFGMDEEAVPKLPMTNTDDYYSEGFAQGALFTFFAMIALLAVNLLHDR